jgi:hypothetical protein
MSLRKLIELANRLDAKGLHKEADVLDLVLLKLAMSSSEAHAILGIKPGATEDEIQDAWKRLVRLYHPDVNKATDATEKTQAINAARSVLLSGSDVKPFNPPEYQRPGHRPPEAPRREEPQGIDWDTAAKKAGVPSGVKWLFRTAVGHGGGEYDQYSMVVFCGEMDGSYVFVGVHCYTQQANLARGASERYTMWVHPRPIRDFASLEVNGASAIRAIWSSAGGVRGYNGKIVLLPEGTEFGPMMAYAPGRELAYKDAMSILSGAPKKTTPGAKVDIVLELGDLPGHFSMHQIVLVVDGRPFVINAESNEVIQKKSNLIKLVFGTYAYSGSKKHLTKINGGKRILEYLAVKLEGKEPPELIEALKQAAQNAKE